MLPSPDKVLDVRGLHCPMPVIKTKLAIDGMKPGEVLKVISTDPAAKADIPVLLDRLGHDLISIEERDQLFQFLIKRN